MHTPATSNRRQLKLLSLFLACVLPAVVWGKPEWEPIPADDLASLECKAFPGASAEALIVRQTFDASQDDAWTTQFQRIKIYSPKAAEEQGVMNIEYSERSKVWSLEARVTKPDGKSTEFHKDDFHDSVFVKVDGYKIKRKTLAVPNLEAGDVVELKWMQGTETNIGHYFWWYCQLPIPVRQYTFSMANSQNDYRVLWFNVPHAEMVHSNTLEMKDLPPFEAEPAMAPMRDVRGWFLVSFTSGYMRWFNKDQAGLWQEISAYYGEDYRLLTKPNTEVKHTAKEAIAGAANDDEKLQRLYDFCQQHVSNLDYFDSSDLQQAKKKLENRNHDQPPEKTLQLASGYSHHVNELFASLARSVGFEVREARSASRDATLQVRNPMGWMFMSDNAVAVRRGKEWKIYAPGDYYVPCGMLKSSIESATSLICDEDKTIFENNPVSPASKSQISRKGRFTLDADGNLEGDVEITIDGHPAIRDKSNWRSWQRDEVDTEYRKRITAHLSAADVGNLNWENLQGNKLPLRVSYKLKVPGYADTAGSKIILTPDVFKHGATPFFTAESRKYPIFFDSAWSEHDDIEIVLPEGYTLDAATAPANVGDPEGTLGVRYGVAYKGKAHTLVYKRDFALGANSMIAFQAASYPAIKNLFEAISRSDEHTILLKPKPAAPAASEPPAAAAK
ncbi:MAG: DUF3857 domain-containing protein [Lacunisphaera sp.]